MHESKKRDAAADDTCCRALEVVAKLGWLSKTAWSVSKAVHAFSKPMLVVLADETPADIVQKLLLRYPIVAMQLEGSVIAPNPLPATVTELVLSADFCGSVADLPDTLRAFEATRPSVPGHPCTSSLSEPRSSQPMPVCPAVTQDGVRFPFPGDGMIAGGLLNTRRWGEKRTRTITCGKCSLLYRDEDSEIRVYRLFCRLAPF